MREKKGTREGFTAAGIPRPVIMLRSPRVVDEHEEGSSASRATWSAVYYDDSKDWALPRYYLGISKHLFSHGTESINLNFSHFVSRKHVSSYNTGINFILLFYSKKNLVSLRRGIDIDCFAAPDIIALFKSFLN